MLNLLAFLDEYDFNYEVVSSCVDKVESLTFDSFCLDGRLVKKDAVFLGIEKNLPFINQAVRNGCVAVIVDKKDRICTGDCTVSVLAIENLQEKWAHLLKCFFQLTSFAPKLIGITGTNGKTSSAHFVAQLLSQANYQVGILGTLGNGVFDPKNPVLSSSSLTTLDTISLYQQLSHFKQRNMDYVVMEVSSHGIDQNRIMGLVFDVVCFTNLSREHLDYHNNMEEYFLCKARLFKDYVDKNTHHVINVADGYGRRLYDEIKKDIHVHGENLLSYYYCYEGYSPSMYADLTLLREGDQPLMLQYQGNSYPIAPSLLVNDIEYQNMLCGLAILLALGQPVRKIVEYGSNLHSVIGRMQYVSSLEDDITVIVDYAHTADALSHVLNAIYRSKKANENLICVFGCGGNRDQGKRREMAEVASNLCNYLYITDDNPRNENPECIRQQIIAGISTHKTTYKEIADRGMAIEQAVINAKSGDVVLIAGKGHEKYQLVQGNKLPFDDVEQVKNALKKRLLR